MSGDGNTFFLLRVVLLSLNNMSIWHVPRLTLLLLSTWVWFYILCRLKSFEFELSACVNGHKMIFEVKRRDPIRLGCKDELLLCII